MTERVGVVGLGTMGSQAAWRLAARGADVVGFDRFAPGHDRSAAGGETRIFRSAQFEDPRYVPLLRHADRLWHELQDISGRQLRSLVGCVLMGPPDHGQMQRAVTSATEYDLDHELVDQAGLAERYPQLRIDDGDVALLDGNAGYIRPELTVFTAARMAERLGARLHTYTTVKAIEPDGRGAIVHTDAGTERVDSVVVCAGPWSNTLTGGELAVDVKRLINAWFIATEHDWWGDRSTAFIRTAPVHCYGVPSPDGISVKLGLSSQWHAPVDDPDTLDRTVRPEELDVFRSLLESYFPDLHPDPVRLSVFMEGYTPDAVPIIRPLPDHPQIIVLAGFSGHGFKLSPGIGDLAADLALNGATPLPVGFLGVPVVSRT